MKKLALALVLAATTGVAHADTYFKFGFEQLEHDFTSVANIKETLHTKDGSLSLGSTQEGLIASGKDQSLVLGVGTELGDFVAVEFRYHMNISSSSKRDQYIPSSSSYSPYGGHFSMKEEQRADALVLLYSPDFFGVRPYLTAGATTAKLKVNEESFNNNGLVYGAGLEFAVTDNLSLSVEYLKYPNSEYGTIKNSGYDSDIHKPLTGDQVSSSYASTYKNEWSGDRASLTLAYRF